MYTLLFFIHFEVRFQFKGPVITFNNSSNHGLLPWFYIALINILNYSNFIIFATTKNSDPFNYVFRCTWGIFQYFAIFLKFLIWISNKYVIITKKKGNLAVWHLRKLHVCNDNLIRHCVTYVHYCASERRRQLEYIWPCLLFTGTWWRF